MKEYAKFQLIWKTLASTSFTKASLRQELLKKHWGSLARQTKLNFVTGQLFGWYIMPKKFGGKWENINSTYYDRIGNEFIEHDEKYK